MAPWKVLLKPSSGLGDVINGEMDPERVCLSSGTPVLQGPEGGPSILTPVPGGRAHSEKIKFLAGISQVKSFCFRTDASSRMSQALSVFVESESGFRLFWNLTVSLGS